MSNNNIASAALDKILAGGSIGPDERTLLLLAVSPILPKRDRVIYDNLDRMDCLLNEGEMPKALYVKVLSERGKMAQMLSAKDKDTEHGDNNKSDVSELRRLYPDAVNDDDAVYRACCEIARCRAGGKKK